jgi:hypothetical protein
MPAFDGSAWRTQRPAPAIFSGALATAAFLTPLWAAEPDRMSGLLLLGGVGAELIHSFRLRTSADQRAAWASAALTLLLALVLLNTSWLAVTALAIFVAAPFALDALRRGGAALRQLTRGQPFQRDAASALANLAALAGVLLVERYALNWLVGVAAGGRLAAVTVNVMTAPSYSQHDIDESVIDDIGLDKD